MSRWARVVVAVLAVTAVVVIGVAWPGGTRRAGAERAEVVYYPLLTNGFEYRRVPYPEEVATIRILAGDPVVFEAHRSLVSFWPITRQYLADFAKLDETVPGTPEVIDAAGHTTAFAPVLYTLWYPRGLGAEPELVTGDAARQTYDAYVTKAAAAFEADRRYQMAVAKLQQEVDDWLAMAAAGVDPLPPPPAELNQEPPEPYPAYATEPTVAPVVALPAGSYHLRWRGDDGGIVAGSERTLEVFGATKTGVSYTLIPYDRWTQPGFSFDPSETVYLAEHQDVFLTPLRASRYGSYPYARLLEPQTLDATDPHQDLWIPDDTNPDFTGFALETSGGGEATGTVPWQGYRVYQQPDATRGYSIEPFSGEGNLQPDFMAMRLPVEGSVTGIDLVGPDGTVVGNSHRDVRRVPAVPRAALYLPAVASLAFALWIRLGRARRPGNEAEPG